MSFLLSVFKLTVGVSIDRVSKRCWAPFLTVGALGRRASVVGVVIDFFETLQPDALST